MKRKVTMNTKVNDKKPYVMQKVGGYYDNVLAENFWIELLGFNPFSRPDGMDMPYYPKYDLAQKGLKQTTSLKVLKKAMIDKLLYGKMIRFAYAHPHGFHNWALITHYYPEFDSFRIIDAQLLTNESPVEYLTFEELTKTAYLNTKGLRDHELFNEKERTNSVAKLIITETKVLTPVNNALKKLKKPQQSDYLLVENL